MIHKIVSGVLGVLSLAAGVVAFVGYALPALQDLMPKPAGVIIYRGDGDTLSQRIFGVLIIWGLTIAAFYMGFRLLRFLNLPRKRQLSFACHKTLYPLCRICITSPSCTM